ncbi:MAG TPA: hypothetical protein VGH76_19675 [Actinomycetospora sp.]|uniref:GREB1-related protein n=1 Tax=Actinomycetospora sp. TaxID=1872135 RepID=UPI002F3F41C4
MIRRGRPSEYQVAIPSYRRPAVLTTKTLPTLIGGGVVPERITVFLHADDPDLEDYRALLPYDVDVEVTGAVGITAQRAAILNAYPVGCPLVQVDDDLSGLVKALDAKRTAPVTDIDAVFRSMFYETAARDLWVWGLSPTSNAFYMTPGRITTGLRFCIGTVLGTYTRPGHPVHDGRAATKEDYELCLRAWWWDGGVVRADGIAPDADHYTAGGCSELRTPDVEEASVQALLADWPGLVRRNEKRRSGYPEIKLAVKPRAASHPTTVPPPGTRRVGVTSGR